MPDAAQSPSTDAAALTAFLASQGYTNIRDLGDGRWAALLGFIFTHAIIVGDWRGAWAGYEDRWCYRTEDTARAALEAWDGHGEPTGWHRHPDSGRRVSEDGREYVQP